MAENRRNSRNNAVDQQPRQETRQQSRQSAPRQQSRQPTPRQQSAQQQDSSQQNQKTGQQDARQQVSREQSVIGQTGNGSWTQSRMTLGSKPERGSRIASWGGSGTASRNSQSTAVRVSMNSPTPEDRRALKLITRNPKMMFGHAFISRQPLLSSRSVSYNEEGFKLGKSTFTSSHHGKMELPRVALMFGGYPNGTISFET